MSESYYPKFAELLNHYLTQSDRSATWLAGRLVITPSAVSRWCNGISRPKSPEVIIRLADSLGIYEEAKRRQLLQAATVVTQRSA